jgi:hypothetical protein
LVWDIFYLESLAMATRTKTVFGNGGIGHYLV